MYAGCGNQGGEDNRDVARMAVLLAGFPKEVPGVTVNRNCASALEAVNQAAKSILAGEGSLTIGSGVECMSRAPWAMAKPERVPTNRAPKLWDTTVGWRFNNPRTDALYPIVSLGETAENVAEQMQITREDQDAFAFQSQRRAVDAIKIWTLFYPAIFMISLCVPAFMMGGAVRIGLGILLIAMGIRSLVKHHRNGWKVDPAASDAPQLREG